MASAVATAPVPLPSSPPPGCRRHRGCSPRRGLVPGRHRRSPPAWSRCRRRSCRPSRSPRPRSRPGAPDATSAPMTTATSSSMPMYSEARLPALVAQRGAVSDPAQHVRKGARGPPDPTEPGGSTSRLGPVLGPGRMPEAVPSSRAMRRPRPRAARLVAGLAAACGGDDDSSSSSDDAKDALAASSRSPARPSMRCCGSTSTTRRRRSATGSSSASAARCAPTAPASSRRSTGSWPSPAASRNFSSRLVSTGNNVFVRLGGADFELGESTIARINQSAAQSGDADGLAAIGLDPLAAVKDVRERGKATVAGPRRRATPAPIDVDEALDQIESFLRRLPRQSTGGRAGAAARADPGAARPGQEHVPGRRASRPTWPTTTPSAGSCSPPGS